MKYKYDGPIHKAIYLSRPNRFLAEIDLNGRIVEAHVKNTGRMREILKKGNTCYIMEAKNKNRKTKYDLITMVSDGEYINLDSQVPNRVISDAFLNSQIEGYENPSEIKREYTVGDSRLDMLVMKDEKRLYVEVKGVDLIIDGQARFPDAVTDRGSRHLRELEKINEMGYGAMVIFLVQRQDASSFRPHEERDPLFAETFYRVADSGVEARAYLTKVGPDYIELDRRIPIEGL